MQIRYLEPELIIEINRKIIEEWNDRHPEQPEFIDVSRSRLNEVLEFVRQAGEGSIPNLFIINHRLKIKAIVKTSDNANFETKTSDLYIVNRTGLNPIRKNNSLNPNIKYNHEMNIKHDLNHL